MPEHSVPTSHHRRHRRKAAHSSQPKLLRVLDLVQGSLIVLLIIAAPWLFGCTETWSVRLMNNGAYVLGICTLITCFFAKPDMASPIPAPERRLARLFLISNLLVLLFCLTAYWNARATFSVDTLAFTYRQGVVSWLPTTYDQTRTGQFLKDSLGLFAFFWSTRAWLLSAASMGERHSGSHRRFNLLVAVFVVNGFLLALQGLLQRFSNHAELLWFRTPYSDDPRASFGPFAYRGNAADYLNLVWPITFGFWYVLARHRDRRTFGIGDGPELLLLPMFFITAAASFATLSRGGALIAAVMLVILVAALLSSGASRPLKISLAITTGAVIVTAFLLSGDLLAARFRAAVTDNLSGRTEIYRNARQIASDFPWFGSGPGTFLSVYHLYRENPGQWWAAFLHDDWLETRVTFGRIGMALVLLPLALLFVWALVSRKRWISPVLSFAFLLSIFGCLVHAKRDFPFQTYGVFFTFIVVCAFLSSAVSRSSTGSGSDTSLQN